MKVRLQNIHNMAYIAPKNMRKYQTILNNMITLRAKEELNKTELFGSQKHDAENFAMHSNFCYIAKISLYSENFSMIERKLSI